MYVIQLHFAANKARAKDFMSAHNSWLQQGFDDGVFILAGSIDTAKGGAILAHNESLIEVTARIAQDPFVQNDVVSPKIISISASKTDPRLAFLAA